jgi:putative methyltransferase
MDYFGDKCEKDAHIPDLLVFPPSTDLHAEPMVINREIILQDKASCFPAYILAPSQYSEVIDACSAPGNKTSHLAAIMKGTGTIYAFEKDPKRYQTLSKMMKLTGCSSKIATTICANLS